MPISREGNLFSYFEGMGDNSMTKKKIKRNMRGRILNNEVIMERVNNVFGEGMWKLISEDRPYVNVHMRHDFQCLQCDEVFDKSVNDMFRGRGCSSCAGLTRRTNEEWKEIVADSTESEYLLISDHDRTRHKALFKHNIKECGNEFPMRIHSFVTLGQRCPECAYNVMTDGNGRLSSGARRIKKFLDKRDINYEMEKTFDDCYHEILLRFDFYLPDKNIIIEYDGEQHFKSIPMLGGDEYLKNIQIRDTVKNNYCKDNHIKLIRIPYYKKNKVYEILNEEIK